MLASKFLLACHLGVSLSHRLQPSRPRSYLQDGSGLSLPRHAGLALGNLLVERSAHDERVACSLEPLRIRNGLINVEEQRRRLASFQSLSRGRDGRRPMDELHDVPRCRWILRERAGSAKERRLDYVRRRPVAPSHRLPLVSRPHAHTRRRAVQVPVDSAPIERLVRYLSRPSSLSGWIAR